MSIQQLKDVFVVFSISVIPAGMINILLLNYLVVSSFYYIGISSAKIRICIYPCAVERDDRFEKLDCPTSRVSCESQGVPFSFTHNGLPVQSPPLQIPWKLGPWLDQFAILTLEIAMDIGRCSTSCLSQVLVCLVDGN